MTLLAIFIGLVLCGLFFVWKKGVLDWGPEHAGAIEETEKVSDAA